MDKRTEEILEDVFKKREWRNNRLANIRAKLGTSDEFTQRECVILFEAIDSGYLTKDEVFQALETIEQFYIKRQTPKTEVQSQINALDDSLLIHIHEYFRKVCEVWSRVPSMKHLDNVAENWNEYKNAMQKHYREKLTKRQESFGGHIQKLGKNSKFQQELSRIRSKYNIQIQSLEDDSLMPYDLLSNWASNTGASFGEWNDLHLAIGQDLCESFDLELSINFGLIIAALFFGIEPIKLADETYLQRIIHYALAYRPVYEIRVHNDYAEKIMGAFLTIHYLSSTLKTIIQDNGLEDSSQVQFLNEVNDPIRYWINFAYRVSERLHINLEDIPDVLMNTKGIPNSAATGNRELYIRITPNTRQEDILLAWQRIIAERTKLGEGYHYSRLQPRFARDAMLANLVDVQGMTYREAVLALDEMMPEESLLYEGKEQPDNNDIDIVKKSLRAFRPPHNKPE